MNIRPPYIVLLVFLAFIFAAAIAVQSIVAATSAFGFSLFSHWSSGVIPNWPKLPLQFAVLALMALAIFIVRRGYGKPMLGKVLAVIGWVYFFVMLTRLIVGGLGLIDHSWFDGAASTVLHFGLAAFVLVAGTGMVDEPPRKSGWRWEKYLAYPALLAGGYLFFVWLTKTGTPLVLASYLSVLVGGVGIFIHESLSPFRQDWRPTRENVFADVQFLIFVQIAVPLILKTGALGLIVFLANSEVAPLANYWPHSAPILIQVGAMLVIAEFFRYWLHRLMHEFDPVWRLHAVHHASDKLYTVNVGRFHPLDKSIQFLGDALPFILLGVSAQVLAAYFVIYAINGFYQHSNANVRLGFLNWVIAGPEIHRWHHSVRIEEGHTNYGNNLVIWDILFGTRYLPNNHLVADVGIGNSRWPRDFWHQILAPFRHPTEHDPN